MNATLGTRRVQLMDDAGKFHDVTIRTDKQYHYISTPWSANKTMDNPKHLNLKDGIKTMAGCRWMATDNIPEAQREKVWRIHNNSRNNFTLEYMQGLNPYTHFKTPLQEAYGKLGYQLPTSRVDNKGHKWDVMSHQMDMAKHILLRKHCIVAGEMGVGKTLAVFLAIEASLVPMVWYVAPRGVLTAIRAETRKWGMHVPIRYMTYEDLKKTLINWKPGDPAPRFVVFDESSRVKTWSSQRTQSAYSLAEQMRAEHGLNCWIVLMSGSPAPKSPEDWWSQCEIARPGYIREGDVYKFRDRYAIVEKMSDGQGTGYSRIAAWKDGDASKCGICGKAKSAHIMGKTDHPPVDMPDEISAFNRRSDGLVMVKLKKDCLDLPEKMFRRIRIKPSADMMRAAHLVMAQSKSALEAALKLRELSDGFQYQEVKVKIACNSCMESTRSQCNICSGTGLLSKMEQKITRIDTPKLQVLNDLLDEVEDLGRIVIGAGFTESIDRICEHVKSQGWEFIRLDGRGWASSLGINDPDELYRLFQEGNGDQKIAVVCHPASGGMGLTFTRSPLLVCVSNDYNAESRIQFINRIHRPGMDVNRGATIVDLILLPSDIKILDNLDRKVELQSMSLGDFVAALQTPVPDEIYDVKPAA